jgi:PIN domain nuclease of toxin-antitoxin system
VQARPDRPLRVSDITLWEVATLHAIGRIRLGLPVREWPERATAAPLVARCGITPAVVAEVASLPPSFPRDPADRIIAATARVLEATLLTSDESILAAAVVPTVC